MIGLHIEVRKKMHDVPRTASAGTSIPGTKLRKKPIIQVGRRWHYKKDVFVSHQFLVRPNPNLRRGKERLTMVFRVVINRVKPPANGRNIVRLHG